MTTGVPKFTASAYEPTYLRFRRMFDLVFGQSSEAGSAKSKVWVTCFPLDSPSLFHARRRALTSASPNLRILDLQTWDDRLPSCAQEEERQR